ncbi:hypothetical protein MSG28_015241 [Choristoneura fumiferana]|uniref:Uncharacterized protein n=1 Tax=Choristoneura fumiferana TaxID=7141 RepID=A0ACC0KYU6_CHOFU|nr:hypothetical protein MSG28_015241 [Choristoneura fumiferana]
MDGADLDVLAEPREPVRVPPVRKALSVNVHPDDTEVIKGAIQKLLGKEKIEHILQLVSELPSHSPPPEQATPSHTKAAFLSALTEPYRVAEADVEQDDIEARTTGKPGTTGTEAASTEVVKSRRGQMQKWSNPEGVKSISGQIQKWSNPEVVKSRSGQIQKWSNPEVVKCRSGQMQKWSNAEVVTDRQKAIFSHHKPHKVVGPCARSARIATTILLANPAVKQQCLHCCVDSPEGIQQMDWFDRQNMDYPAISLEGPPPPISASAPWNISGTSAMVAGPMGGDGTSALANSDAAVLPNPKQLADIQQNRPKGGSNTPCRIGLGLANITASPSPMLGAAPAAYNASDPYFRVGDNRTRYTRRTLGSTLNTLCTESDDVCRTMCFDREKYRISCPTTTPRPTTPYLDMTRLLHMLSSLVADYDTNITTVLNNTLYKKGYKHCEPTTTETTTTTTMPPPTPPMFDYEPSEMTGRVIAKCYVCGMEELGIPRDAHCADPFAKDLLPPAMPDHIAETKRKGFRKYCNYMDMKPWYINGSGIWGKWTGGCVVRWVDLSGVYTQRVCRIRDRPALGNHFVSKRLAKLEFALRKVDNGCMLSPMATLVPFSRGVSLYARLHVCVCSANWCNRAHWPAGVQGLWVIMILFATVLR